MVRRRLDKEMLRRGLVHSREEAKRAILSKQVLVNGAIAEKAARMVAPSENILIQGEKPKYVSRAGEKLAGALKTFAIDPNGWVCIDAGSSTGGFTDCLIQAGAAGVIAVDVGTHQLHEKLRGHPKVDLFEKTDIRNFDLSHSDLLLDGSFCDLAVADVSFISIKLVLEKLLSFVTAGGELVVLVKPQFEAGKVEVSKGKGVICNPLTWQRVLLDVLTFSCHLGMEVVDIARSSVTGTNGNVEFVVHLRNADLVSSADVSADIHASIISAIEAEK